MLNKNIFTIIIVIVIGGGILLYTQMTPQPIADNATNSNTNPTQPKEVTSNKTSKNTPESMIKKNQQRSNYMDYSPENFEQANTQRRILFFHASWCPTCKQANTDFQTNSSELPEDIVIFKVNYDTETQLKEKHGITYQHTFVQVDSAGNLIKKWNGGQVKEVLSNLQ